MATYRLCTTPRSLLDAHGVLSKQAYIYLDCEGLTLGEEEGKLSLLNLGCVDEGGREEEDAQPQLRIFLIDVPAFRRAPSLLLPIFLLLTSSTVYKVVFDGRMDASELLHGHGVQLNNVLDLQLADVVSRKIRGEDDAERLRRLRGFLEREDVYRRDCAQWKGVVRLNGMAAATREHGIEKGDKQNVDHALWMHRPLPQLSAIYAAEDILKIFQIHTVFRQRGYLDSESSESWLAKRSARYLALHATARPEIGDIYTRHGLLPLGILDDEEEEGAGRTMVCRGCERELDERYFRGEKKTKGSKNVGDACMVCLAVETRQARRK